MIAVLSLGDVTAGYDCPIKEDVNPTTNSALGISISVYGDAGGA
jgi:hypothetical protein